MQKQISRDSELFGGQLALMVACHGGNAHTIVLTVGGLWTCGTGQYGLLGHGDETDKIVLTQVVVECFEGNAQIVMVVGGEMHSVAVGSEGGVWTWGCRVYLGHSDVQHRHVPNAAAWQSVFRGQSGDGGRGRLSYRYGNEQGCAVGLGQQYEWPAGHSKARAIEY